MNCSNCGASIPEGSDVRVCGSCGARVTRPDSASYGGPGASQIPRALRPRSVGEILDETIRLFRENFRTFIGIVAIVQVPLFILQMVQFAIVGPAFQSFSPVARGGEIQPGSLVFLQVSSFVLGLLTLLAFTISQAALASAISERYLGRQATVGGAYRVALACFWRVVRTNILVTIILVLLAITIIGIPFAIIRIIRWALVVPAVVFEGVGARQARSRSASLVKGSWWRVLGVLIVASIAQYLVSVIPASAIGYGLGSLGRLISSGSPLWIITISAVVGAAFGILAAPLVPTVSTLLYYDLRIRKEGYDLEVLAEHVGQG